MAMSTEGHGGQGAKGKSADFGPALTVNGGGLAQRLGWFSATMIVVGSMIGTGIFTNTSVMADYLQTPGIVLGLWIFGGLFTLLGAMAYGELAAMAPHAGGQYVFLREAFGRFWAFLYGWTLFLVIQTGFVAAVSIGFAKFLGVFFPGLGERNVLFSVNLADLLPGAIGWGSIQLNSAQLVACAVIIFLTAVNILGVREGAFIQNLFTVLKLTALGGLIVVGLTSPRTDFTRLVDFAPQVGPKALEIGLLAGLAVTLSKALFAYDAWNTVTFVAEEVRRPEKTLPRALVLGCLITTGVYVFANLAYMANLPLADMTTEKIVEENGVARVVKKKPNEIIVDENRVAPVVAKLTFDQWGGEAGKWGERLVVVAILISTFGCVNGLILGGARVSYAMAQDGLFFKQAGKLHPTRRTPVVALVYLGLWSCVLTLSGTFDALLTYTTFAAVLFGALTVAGVFRLRATEPDRPRPYRCWGYPLTPALYLLIAVPFLIYVVLGDPQSTGIGLLLVLTGVPVYFWWRRSAAGKGPASL
jgi:APA family basic amino acid/polyamine antiporter